MEMTNPDLKERTAHEKVAKVFEDLIDEHDFAREIGMHISSVRRLCRLGVYASVKVGRKRFISVQKTSERIQPGEPSPLEAARGRGRPRKAAA